MEISKILVIDDEPGIINVVTAYLQSDGYNYQTAGDGVEGFEARLLYLFIPAGQSGEGVHFIFCSTEYPGEFLRQVICFS